jgi:hypothetical protein
MRIFLEQTFAEFGPIRKIHLKKREEMLYEKVHLLSMNIPLELVDLLNLSKGKKKVVKKTNPALAPSRLSTQTLQPLQVKQALLTQHIHFKSMC